MLKELENEEILKLPVRNEAGSYRDRRVSNRGFDDLDARLEIVPDHIITGGLDVPLVNI
jgi:hypothetical protein